MKDHPREHPAEDSLVGALVLDQYQIIRPLARGGMSSVYLAEQAFMDRKAVVKIVRAEDTLSQERNQRFRQEARAASRLKHPNIITVYNFGELADGSLFLAMEYIEGQSLAQRISEGPLPCAQALGVARQCACALSYAHSMNIVHRDFKPENVMISELMGQIHVTVLDFGIARLVEDSSQTQSGALLGTPRYMSPEQCRGEVATASSDQYALGLVLYEMLTGTPAITAESSLSYLHMHQRHVPPPPSTVRDLPSVEQCNAIVMRMLSKRPEDRFPGWDDVIDELDRAARQLGQPSRDASSQVALFNSEEEERERETVADYQPAVSQAADGATPGPMHVLVSLADGEGLLRQDDLGMLRERGFELQDRHSGHEAAPDLWVAGARGTDPPQSWGPPEKTLVCLDAPLGSRGLKAAATIFRNTVVGPHPVDPTILSLALAWLHRGKGSGLELLHPFRAIQAIEVTSSARKSAYVDSLVEDAAAQGASHRTRRALAELSEEMIMNAIFHAPVDAEGNPRHAHLKRSTDITLTTDEAPILRWLIDERFVALSIRDPFGSISAEEILNHVCGDDLTPNLDSATMSAGMGLRIMSRAAQHLVFSISPSAWCEVLALVPRLPSDTSSERRSLCVLQGVGQLVQKIGARLTLTETRRDNTTCVELQGEINETCDLRPLFDYSGIVRVDMRRVSRINSVGIQIWLRAMRERPDDLDLVLERCSLATVSQINMVPLFAEPCRIASIVAPYYCAKCQKETLQTVQSDEFDQELPPRRQCSTCGHDLAFNDLPDEYFAFLKA